MSDLIVLHGCATIQLSKGFNTLVDVDDWPELSKRAWHANTDGGLVYASCRRPRTYIHRLVAGTPAGLDTDHINGDGLDNRRSNLRACSRRKNLANQRPMTGTTSRWKGVHWDKRARLWKAKIYRGRYYHLGYFKTEHEAALAYNEAAIRLDGEFARLNDVVAPLNWVI